jgi:drug/metabolite transporter (DMT)-like permease
MENWHHRRITSSKPIISPFLGLAFAILAVSASAIFIRLAQGDAPSMIIAAYRLIFASMILAIPAWVTTKKEIQSLDTKDWLTLLLSGLFLAIHFGSWITSLEYTSIASSVVIVTTSPLWVAILSPLILKEKIPIPVRWGLVIAMLGGLLVAGAQSFSADSNMTARTISSSGLWGQFLALLGAIFVAGYLIIGRTMRKTVSLVTYTFLVYGFAAIFLLGFVLYLDLPLFGYQPQTYLLFLAMAVFPQLLGHSTFNWALKYLPAVVIAIATLGEPVGATLLGYMILNETPRWLEGLGGAVILSGIIIASIGNQNKQ